MHLPQEIRNEVASYLLHIQFDTRYESFFHSYYHHDSNGEERAIQLKWNPFFEVKLALGDLLNLRLVSHEWNATVTGVLQAHCWWTFKLDSTPALERATAICLSGQSRLARKVKLADMYHTLPFKREYEWDDGFGDDESDGGLDDDSYMADRTYDEVLIRQKDGTRQLHHDKSNEYGLLRKALGRLDKLDAFDVSFPECVCSDENEADCYDMQAVDDILAIIQVALKSDAFQNLSDLRLNIPCTKDMERFVDAMTNDVRNRLRHLSIEIMDSTAQDGDSGSMNTGDPHEPGVQDGASLSSCVPPSNLQVAFPNKAHQKAVWDFVGSCSNLESLNIRGTHYLDLDQLDWQKSSTSRGLCAVSLFRVYASISSIIKLLSPSPSANGPPALRCINMEDIKVHVTGGDWAELFTFLRESCPNIEAMKPYQLTYFQDHERFMHNNRPWENGDYVWTENDNDWDELRALTQVLIDRAGGVEYYPEPCSENIMEED